MDSEYLKNSGPEYGCHDFLAGEFTSAKVGVKGVYFAKLKSVFVQ
jgi:hypothetical protein